MNDKSRLYIELRVVDIAIAEGLHRTAYQEKLIQAARAAGHDVSESTIRLAAMQWKLDQLVERRDAIIREVAGPWRIWTHRLMRWLSSFSMQTRH